MSFLDKVKGKIEEKEMAKQAEEKSQLEAKAMKRPQGYMQLQVDLYQTSKEITIVALMPGVEIKDIDISIENENDVITIRGNREMPVLYDAKTEEKGLYLSNECEWGNFYRQIVLPQEIDVAAVEAKMAKHILYIKLPFLRIAPKGKRKIDIASDATKK